MPVAAPTAPPPPAPPPGVTIVQPSTPPKAPPPPTKTIHVPSAPATDTGPASPPPKPGSAKANLRSALYKKAGITEPPVAPDQGASPERPGGDSPSPESPPPSPDSGSPEPAVKPDPGTPAPPAAPDQPTQGKTKTNPWKLLDEWKGKATNLEKELLEARKSSVTEQEKNTYLTQIQDLQKQNKALEDKMAFMDYEQTSEFQEKYHQPYQKAFERAISEMGELTITDPETNQTRNVTDQDIMALCQLNLADARKVANSLYGEFADDMMAHRKEIRSMFKERQEALNKAREQGSERVKQQKEMSEKQQRDLTEFAATTWTSVNEEAHKHPEYGKFFTPIEGDQDGNQRLAKGFELVDRAFHENPQDPNLTPEERKEIIRRHAMVRNRAAAAGRLVAWHKRDQARIAELEKELESYKSSTPTTGGSPQPAAGTEAAATARERVFNAFRAKAR